jgi:peptidyl-prolyl cis-trans isomerase B (cyclophilin B)
MSQPPKKRTGTTGSGSSAANTSNTGKSSTGAKPPTTSGSRGTTPPRTGTSASKQTSSGSRPPATRQPVARNAANISEPGSFRERVDRTLPPFTARRYIAIWLLGMIPLILILLWLAQPWNNNSAGSSTQAQSTPTTVGEAYGGATGATSAPQPNTGDSGGAAGASTSGPGKYLVIDTSKGKIVAKLYTEPSAKVGNTIANFEKKSAAGEFNGRVFHRVEDWVIQGGDPRGNGTGGGDMPSEYNDITFKAGALGIARGGDPAINNDSQFFITKTDAPFLDGQYTNWGQVVEGMDVVNQIAIGDKINSMTVEQR